MAKSAVHVTEIRERQTVVLGQVALLIQKRLGAEEASQVEQFAAVMFDGVSDEDVENRTAEDLYGAALSFWRLFGKARHKAPTIKVFNPAIESDGWESAHTVIAIANDDMPFLVDSTTAYLSNVGLTVHFLIHPIFLVHRDESGALIGMAAHEGRPEFHRESGLLLEVDRRTAPDALESLRNGLQKVLGDVRTVVDDWAPMLERLAGVEEQLTVAPPPLTRLELDEDVAFLRWMHDDHFTFLGYRDFIIDRDASGGVRYRENGAGGLGLLRDPEMRPLGVADQVAELPAKAQEVITSSDPVLITKAASRSTVHRAVPLDLVGIKRFNAAGEVVGECRFVGLFTSAAYSGSAHTVPVLRRRVRNVLERAGFRKGGHARKALEHILETLPRDELFQITDDELLALGLGILNVEERQRTGLFVRIDPFERFVSCLVYLPRERFDTDLRIRVQNILEGAFAGLRTSFTTQLSDSPLARIHFIVDTTMGGIPSYDRKEIEERIADATRSWSDRLHDSMIERFGEERGKALVRTYADAFPAAYRDEVMPHIAVADIERLEAARTSGLLAMNLYHLPEQKSGTFGFRIYHPARAIALSDLLPRLENLGLWILSERPYRIRPRANALEKEDRSPALGPDGTEELWVHDLTVIERDRAEVDIAHVRADFQEAFEAIWYGAAEDDGFNRLVLVTDLGWREVAVLRAACKYLLQTGIPFSQAYMEDTLCRNTEIACQLIDLFNARFDPDARDEAEAKEIRADIVAALNRVASLDEDRILHRYLNLIQSTLRTNYFQREADGTFKASMAFKFNSETLDGLPLPKPWVETFVYAPQVEGIHLRGGKVARGGIRWSDRREDFRTEILGLMKAQMVKNAVIVPVGAKGGFVVKRPPKGGHRAAVREDGISCYRTFISGLLDLADNRNGTHVEHPPQVVCYDDDDPYLVVAADKGTATFSDIANEISEQRGFWLGDAFASGGHVGYDHKAMGITARGAWESVKRHFREMGRDVQTEPFTVIGVGDMSGDVFGNGMLLSENIELVGAFNHRFIFLDPNPDAARSFTERKRLFDAPVSNWNDYDSATLSEGGGIVERAAKSFMPSAELCARLGIEHALLTPAELIKALLRAPVDLIWFGGIGCYVKAHAERNADVGDRTNDDLRIDARELRCRAIGEGANLALTQAGRIEFAARGGRINTDAVDNSAGVDCSDNEVNIKIVLNDLVARGDMTRKQRDQMLPDMTEEVGTIVLRHNYLQTQAISVVEARAVELLEAHGRLMRELVRRGRLNRAVEALPSEEEIAERAQANRGLTRPEISVLLAYAKTTLFTDLMESDVPEDPYLAGDLQLQMPSLLRQTQPEAIRRHRLRREIIATSIANSIVNRAGPEFVSELAEETGASIGHIARAYAAARHVFDLRDTWSAVEALDNKVSSAAQTEMLVELQHLLEHATLWFLRNRAMPLDISDAIAFFSDGITRLRGKLESVLSTGERQRFEAHKEKLADLGVPAPLAQTIAGIEALFPACDIIEVAHTLELGVEDVARVYFELDTRLRIDWLRMSAEQISVTNHWQHRALTAIVDDLYGQQRALCLAVLKSAGGKPEGAIDAWMATHQGLTSRVMAMFDEFKQSEPLDLAMLAVANRQMRSLIVAGRADG